MSSKAKATARIDLKATAEVRDPIDRGAGAAHKRRTELMLDAPRVAADEAIMARTSFAVDPEAWDEFNRMLDEHDWENDPGFVDLMGRTPQWK